MHCSSCGAPLPGGATTCPKCGVAIGHPTNTAPYMQFGSFEEPVEQPVLSLQRPTLPNIDETSQSFVTDYGPSIVPSQPRNLLSQAPVNSSGYTSPQAFPHFVQPPTPKVRSSRGMLIALLALAVLLVLGGVSILYYAAVYRPAELNAQATSQAKASATAYANSPQGIYTLATRGAPVIDTPLDGKIITTWGIYNLPTYNSSCTYKNGAYHVTNAKKDTFYECLAHSNFENFAMQVQMTIVAGVTGGVVFRLNTNNLTFYRFTLTVNGYCTLFTRSASGNYVALYKNYSPFAHLGLNQTNLLTAVALGSTIYLYVNKQFLVKVTDNTYSSGDVGLLASDYTEPADIAFNNAQIWSLS